MSRVGERVGAILGSNKDKGIDFLGYGVYEGDFVPEEAVGFMAEIAREQGHTNPRILLDSGSHVYGCECWWGNEEKIRKTLEGQKVNKIEIDKVREEYSIHHAGTT